MTWEDAPSHICRGGDKRGLAFCCPPVKPCPILNALDEVNLTPQEYIDIKTCRDNNISIIRKIRPI